MDATTRVILEHNGERWGYDFHSLSVQQIFAAQSWFVFYNDTLLNPPASAKQLKMTGATDYMQEAISLLILPYDGEKLGEFNPAETPQKALLFLSKAQGAFDKVREIQKDFFLRSGTSSQESILKSKKQQSATAILLRSLMRGEKMQGE